ncbi:MAG: hypothetical protein JNM29_00825 [Candidatus Odyssella sp.]|nr:hypothetical protein [Candidatus Odyssella sp.]
MTSLRAAALLIAALAFAGAARAETAPDWSGRYGYAETGGRTAGGTGIVVTHRIAVTREGGQYRAEITASGYQTQVQIFALGTVLGSKLQLRFERDGDEQMFKGRYRPGALLLELERAGGRRIVTHWGAYAPATTERFRNPGAYFKREEPAATPR